MSFWKIINNVFQNNKLAITCYILDVYSGLWSEPQNDLFRQLQLLQSVYVDFAVS